MVVKVVATNLYGNSADSPNGQGAVIQLVPDAPIDLLNDGSVTSDTVIRFTWTDGASDGGSPVLDYSVYWDNAGSEFVLLASQFVEQYYMTTATLTPGAFYKFKVTSRNSVGDSQMSAEIEILAATKPDAPTNLVNDPANTSAYQIGITWTQGAYNGGSDVVDYEVSFKE